MAQPKQKVRREKKTRRRMDSKWRENIRRALNRPEVKAKLQTAMKGNQFAKGYKWTPEQRKTLSRSLKRSWARRRAS